MYLYAGSIIEENPQALQIIVPGLHSMGTVVYRPPSAMDIRILGKPGMLVNLMVVYLST